MTKKFETGTATVNIRQDVDVSRAVEQIHILASRIRAKGLLTVNVVVSPDSVGAAVGGVVQSPEGVRVGSSPPVAPATPEQKEPEQAPEVPEAAPAPSAPLPTAPKAPKGQKAPRRPWDK